MMSRKRCRQTLLESRGFSHGHAASAPRPPAAPRAGTPLLLPTMSLTCDSEVLDTEVLDTEVLDTEVPDTSPGAPAVAFTAAAAAAPRPAAARPPRRQQPAAAPRSARQRVLAWCAAMKARQPLADIGSDTVDGAARLALLGDGSLPHIAAALWLSFKLLGARNSELSVVRCCFVVV
jgi:hypothetical protein